MGAYIIWDDGARFESDIFYFAQNNDAGSNPVIPIVAIAEMVKQRVVVSPIVGSSPTSHLSIIETSQVQSLD